MGIKEKSDWFINGMIYEQMRNIDAVQVLEKLQKIN